MGCSVATSLKRFDEATSERDGAYRRKHTYERLRKQRPDVEIPEANNVDDQISEGQKAVEDARGQVSESTPVCLTEALQKVRALIGTDINQDEVAAIKNDIDELLLEDPIVELCGRWKVANEYIRKEYEKDTPLPPEVVETENRQSELRDRILSITPSSPEGLAAFMDLVWDYFEPGYRFGTDSWADSMERPGTKLLLSARQATYLLAGKVER